MPNISVGDQLYNHDWCLIIKRFVPCRNSSMTFSKNGHFLRVPNPFSSCRGSNTALPAWHHCVFAFQQKKHKPVSWETFTHCSISLARSEENKRHGEIRTSRWGDIAEREWERKREYYLIRFPILSNVWWFGYECFWECGAMGMPRWWWSTSTIRTTRIVYARSICCTHSGKQRRLPLLVLAVNWLQQSPTKRHRIEAAAATNSPASYISESNSVHSATYDASIRCVVQKDTESDIVDRKGIVVWCQSPSIHQINQYWAHSYIHYGRQKR